jgi:hypothetical protein
MKNRLIHVCIILLLCAGLLPAPAPVLARAGDGSTTPAESTGSLQYLVGSQVLLFQPGQVTLAAADHALRVEFLGASNIEPQETESGADRQLGQVTYADLWPGIDLRYEQSDGNPKSTYTLAPGADPAAIRLHYNRAVEIQPDGSLEFAFERGSLTESTPLAWQDTPSGRHAVDVRFVLHPDGSLGFEPGAYNPALALVIDPDYEWHTFYGGYDITETAGAVYRADGNLLVVGTRYQPRYGDKNIFAVLLDADGNWLDEATFGSLDADDIATGVTERDNQAYVVGYSYASFTVSNREPVHAFSGRTDIVVLYLDPNLSSIWHTFFGSFDDDFGRGIAVSSTWDIYVTGESYSSWIVDSTTALHPYNGGSDLVAIKLDDYGAYQWHTFYGSQADEYAGGACLELDTYLWLSGSSPASWNGPGAVPPVHAHAGGYDLTALVLNSDGSYILHGFYGSSSGDYGKSVAVDSQGLAYLTGYSQATWGTPKHAHSGGNDLVVVKLNDNGDFYWNTFYGSTGDDAGYSVQIDPTITNSNVYLAGTSALSWDGPAGQAPVIAHAGGKDMAALVLTSAGNYVAHTFHGSSADDSAASLAFQSGANLALVGTGQLGWDGPAGEEPVQPFHGVKSTTAVSLQPGLAYAWHTFPEFDFQDTFDDRAESVTALDDGSLLVTGFSQHGFLGPLGETPLHEHNVERQDLYVLKLDAAGGYLWHTFYGAVAESDTVKDIEVDDLGNIYLVGNSGGTWNGPAGQLPKHAFTGSGTNGNLLILKLNDSGAYLWHTFYGPGTAGIPGYGIALDSSGSVYTAGYSEATWNGPSGESPLHAYSGEQDLFVIKVNGKGEYQWHTFYGSAGDDECFDIAAGSSTVVLVGLAESSWLGPIGQHPIQSHSGSIREGVILKLNQNGGYLWHTFHGEITLFNNLYIDADSNIYAGGYSNALWNGPAGQQPTHKPGSKDFTSVGTILKLNAAGAYQWHAFFGAVGSNIVMGIDGGPDGVLYLSGYADGSWDGNGSIPPARAYSGSSRDSVVIRLNDAGLYQWHTFYPASQANDIVYNAAAQRVVVAGDGNATWLGDAGQPPLRAYANSRDIMVLSLIDSGPTPVSHLLFIPFVQR